MAYVEAHATLRDHPKTKKASRILKLEPREVISHLLYLWWWCQDYAQDGNLSTYSVDEIAEAADWENDPTEFVDALINCGRQDEPGFLEIEDDGALVVHDWDQYGGKLFKKRIQGAKRQANWRARHVSNSGVTLLQEVSNASLTHNVTQSNAHREEEIREDKTREDKTREDAPVVVVNQFAVAVRSFENEIGLVSGSYADDMRDMWNLLESAGTTGWWDKAIKLSVEANKRSWSYMRGILSNCLQEGHAPGERNGNGGQHATGRRNGSGAGKPFGLRRDPNERPSREPTDEERAEFLSATPA